MDGNPQESFSKHSVLGDDDSAAGGENHPLFTMKKLKEVVFSINNKKVPRADGIPAEVHKLAFSTGSVPRNI